MPPTTGAKQKQRKRGPPGSLPKKVIGSSSSGNAAPSTDNNISSSPTSSASTTRHIDLLTNRKKTNSSRFSGTPGVAELLSPQRRPPVDVGLSKKRSAGGSSTSSAASKKLSSVTLSSAPVTNVNASRKSSKSQLASATGRRTTVDSQHLDKTSQRRASPILTSQKTLTSLTIPANASPSPLDSSPSSSAQSVVPLTNPAADPSADSTSNTSVFPVAHIFTPAKSVAVAKTRPTSKSGRPKPPLTRIATGSSQKLSRSASSDLQSKDADDQNDRKVNASTFFTPSPPPRPRSVSVFVATTAKSNSGISKSPVHPTSSSRSRIRSSAAASSNLHSKVANPESRKGNAGALSPRRKPAPSGSASTAVTPQKQSINFIKTFSSGSSRDGIMSPSQTMDHQNRSAYSDLVTSDDSGEEKSGTVKETTITTLAKPAVFVTESLGEAAIYKTVVLPRTTLVSPHLSSTTRIKDAMREARDVLRFEAHLAEELGRYEDMSDFITQIVYIQETTGEKELSEEETVLLSTAFKNSLHSKRSACRILRELRVKLHMTLESDTWSVFKDVQNKVENDLRAHCSSLLKLLLEILMRRITNPETRVSLLRMQADALRYLCESYSGVRKYKVRSDSNSAYKEGVNLARRDLDPANIARLSIFLNYSIFLKDLMKEGGEALAISREAFRAGVASLDNLGDKEFPDALTLLDAIKQNVVSWGAEKKQQRSSYQLY